MIERETQIIFVAGPPGSGKTTVSKEYAAARADEGVTFFSMGAHVRSVLAGEVESSVVLQSDRPPARQVIALAHEALAQRVGQTVVMDGFPRFLNEGPYLAGFRRYQALGCITLQINEGVSIARVTGRGMRAGEQQLSDDATMHAAKRFAEYNRETKPVVNSLAQLHDLPVKSIDASQPQAAVATDFAYVADELRASAIR